MPGLKKPSQAFPRNLRGQKPAGLPHSPWMLLEHMRIAQWDILEFSRNRKHVSPDWPKGYWPRGEAPPSRGLEHQHQEISPGSEGHAGPGGKSENRSARPHSLGRRSDHPARSLLVADHNAYHVAQLVDVRRLLGAWPEK